jgi:hypothetical protein
MVFIYCIILGVYGRKYPIKAAQRALCEGWFDN